MHRSEMSIYVKVNLNYLLHLVEMQNQILTDQISRFLFFFFIFVFFYSISPHSTCIIICQHMFLSMFNNHQSLYCSLTCFPFSHHRIRFVCLNEPQAEICAVVWILAALRVAVSVDCVIPVVQPAHFLVV